MGHVAHISVRLALRTRHICIEHNMFELHSAIALLDVKEETCLLLGDNGIGFGNGK